jgi:hypothetical protein
MKKRKGLSILEVILSVSLIGLIIIFIIGMYSTFFTSGTKLNEETIGFSIAKSYMDRIYFYSVNYQNYGTEFNKIVKSSAVNKQENTQFGLYKAQFVGNRSFNLQVVGKLVYSGPVNNIYNVKVGVYWRQINNNKFIRNYGKNYLVIDKLLSVSKF